jgi:hypothetical protein
MQIKLLVEVRLRHANPKTKKPANFAGFFVYAGKFAPINKYMYLPLNSMNDQLF